MEELAQEVLQMAKDAGASDADVLIRTGREFASNVRLGQMEVLKQAENQGLGLRIFVGRRCSIVSTSDFKPRQLREIVKQAVDMARVLSEDPLQGLPEPGALAAADLRIYDDSRLTTEAKILLARRAEQAALSFDPCISRSEGAAFQDSSYATTQATSRGFTGTYQDSTFSLSVVPVAERDGQMQRDYWYSASRNLAGLDSAEQVGRIAARRASRRLGARRVATQKVAVVFEPEMASTLLAEICEAVSGTAIYRKASFLVGKLGERVASPQVRLCDDGRLQAGLGTRPFDGEGCPTQTTTVIEGGVLESYLLDSYSARKLGLASTGNAVRSLSTAPAVGPTNFYLGAGPHSPEQIVASVRRGFLVVELIGFGVNIVNGDYSRGAVGIWIEQGELTHAVEEVTIAGNLSSMLQDIEMVGDDLQFRGAISSPTLKIAEMTVSGE